ncbi:MAG: signal peptidase II [Actinobacteria bacterium]|nr:signal peptidase II [Actinomycetota bacterium]
MTGSGRTPREALPDVISRRLKREAGQRYRLMALIALAVVVLDQLVKVIVRATIAQSEVVDVLPGIDFVHTVNTGIAFSLFSGSTGLIAILTLVAIGVIAIVLVAYAGQHRLVPIGGGLLLGGSIGNLIDRAGRDGVTDFIAIGPWPPFNVADIAITCGAILLVLAIVLSAGDD